MIHYNCLKSISITSLATILICLQVTKAFSGSTISTIAQNSKNAIVTVVAYDDQKKILSQGTGFFIAGERTELITNYHVLRGAHSAAIITHDGKRYRVNSIIGENPKADLLKVLVDLSKGLYKSLEISLEVPTVGERIIVIGSPMGLDQTVSDGIISSRRELAEIGILLQITAPISPGSSGSPVINMKGKVVGIASAQIAKGQNLNFAVPIKHIYELQKEGLPKTVSKWSQDHNLRTPRSQAQQAARLFVDTDPRGATVRILNIKPKFSQGIELSPGKYHIEVSAQGYLTKKLWISLRDGEEQNLSVALEVTKEVSEADKWADSGRTLLKANDYKAAIESFSRAVLLKPDDFSLYLNRAHAYQHFAEQHSTAGDFKTSMQYSIHAIEDCNIAMALLKGDPDLSFMIESVHGTRATYYNLQAATMTELHKEDDASRLYLKALEDTNIAINLAKAKRLEPFSSTYVQRGIAHLGLSEFLKAIKDFNKVIRDYPDDDQMTLIAGVYLTSAYTQYKSGGNPDSFVEAHPSLLAQHLFQEGRFNEAIKAADEAIEIDDEDGFSYRYRGMSNIRLSHFAQGLRDIDKALKINPKDKMAFQYRAATYYSLSNYKQTITDCDMALRITTSESLDANIWFMRGNAFIKLGNFSEAIANFRNAIEREPYNPLFYRRRGFAYAQLGDQQQYLKDLKTAAKLGDSDAENLLKQKGLFP